MNQSCLEILKWQILKYYMFQSVTFGIYEPQIVINLLGIRYLVLQDNLYIIQTDFLSRLQHNYYLCILWNYEKYDKTIVNYCVTNPIIKVWMMSVFLIPATLGNICKKYLPENANSLCISCDYFPLHNIFINDITWL